MNKSLNRPKAKSTLLAVIDIQERLVPAMEEGLRAQLLANAARLGEASKILELDVLLTEQYPKGLGHTVESVRSAFAESVEARAKVTFDAFADADIGAALYEKAPETVLVAGMETHICVYQSVRSLVERGYRVLLLSDAVASRTRANYEVGLSLAREAGAIVTSTETVLFDLLGQAGGDAFKAISKLVR